MNWANFVKKKLSKDRPLTVAVENNKKKTMYIEYEGKTIVDIHTFITSTRNITKRNTINSLYS